jgi:hypothetical protein
MQLTRFDHTLKKEHNKKERNMEQLTFKSLIIFFAMVGFSSCASAQAVGVDRIQLHQALELFVVPAIVASIVWALWHVRAKSLTSDKARLKEAWGIVLSDPNYTHRRRYEEYNREVEARAREAKVEAREIEGL